MLKKFLVFIVTMFNCINASFEEAEIIHCQQINNTASTFMIFRQQQEVQIAGYAQTTDCPKSITEEYLERLRTKLEFIKPITTETLENLRTKLEKVGFLVTSVSLLSLASNKKYTIDNEGWLKEH